MSGDSFWANVSLLLMQDNAANNSTSFVDQSTVGTIFTAGGNAKYSTTHPPTGLTSSGVFDGTSTTKLTSASTTAIQFLTGDFTIETYVYPLNTTAQNICDLRPVVGNGTGFAINFVSTATNVFSDFTNSNVISGARPSVSTWHHLAVVRASNVWKMWLDGSQTGSTYSPGGSQSMGVHPLFVAGFNGSGSTLEGNLAGFRITKAARYTSSFTPESLPYATVGGGPFPHFDRRKLTGGLISMRERLRRFYSLPSGILAPRPGILLPKAA